MRKILFWIYVVLTAGLTVLYYHFRYMVKFAKNPKKWPYEYRYHIVHKLCAKVMKRFRVDFIVKGLDKLKDAKQTPLIISNHYSDSDPIIYLSIIERPLRFVAKKESFDFPFIGKILLALECYSLDRQNIMNQLTQIKEIVKDIKDENAPEVVIFAEGTRNKVPGSHCLELHAGSIKMAYMAHYPLVSFSIYGTHRIFDGKAYLKKFPVFINVGDIITEDDYKDMPATELTDKITQNINADIDEFKKLDMEYVNKMRINKKRKEYETRFDH